jgi:signal transduction protein with GAF and PtsI domain
MFVNMLSRAGAHPNMQYTKGSKEDKYPKYLAHDLPVFNYSGLYIFEN